MTSRSALCVLVLMPMLDGFQGVRAVVAEAITIAGLRMERLDILLEDWEWLDWLHGAIDRCDLVLADPTQHNAFVMYELGLARRRERPTLLLLDQRDSQISGSLDGSAFRLYARDALGELAARLVWDLQDLVSLAHDSAGQLDRESNPYERAMCLLAAFRHDTGRDPPVVDRQAFELRLAHARQHGTYGATLAGTPAGDAGLLAALLRESRMVDNMAALREWTDRRGVR